MTETQKKVQLGMIWFSGLDSDTRSEAVAALFDIAFRSGEICVRNHKQAAEVVNDAEKLGEVIPADRYRAPYYEGSGEPLIDAGADRPTETKRSPVTAESESSMSDKEEKRPDVNDAGKS